MTIVNITANKTIRDFSIAHLRIRIFIPKQHSDEPIFSRLIADHKLTVNLASAVLEASGRPKQLDLELKGTIAQIQSGLAYLESLNIAIRGKSNPAGDSWHY